MTRTLQYFAVLAFACMVLVMCRYIAKHRQVDFDTLMYLACVVNDRSEDAAAAHLQTYALAKRDLPPDEFLALTNPQKPYRLSVANSSANLESQLPLYRQKLLYKWLLTVLTPVGSSTFRAALLINLASYIGLCTLAFLFLRHRFQLVVAATASFCLAASPVCTDTARSLTPDMLTAFLMTAATVSLLSSKRGMQYIGILACMLLVLARPENVIFVGFYAAISFRYSSTHHSRHFTLALAIGAVASILLIIFIARPYSWSILFRHSFLGYIPDLQNTGNGISFIEYMRGLRFLFTSVLWSDLALFVLLLLPVVFFEKRRPQHTMALAILASICVRMFLFPDICNRYYAGVMVAALLLLLSYVGSLPRPSGVKTETAGQAS